MSEIIFPVNPVDGQQFVTGSVTYTWHTDRWASIGPSAASRGATGPQGSPGGATGATGIQGPSFVDGSDISAGVVTATEFEGNLSGNVAGNTTGIHNGDVYARDGSKIILETAINNGDTAHYIGTVTGDVTGDTSGTHYGTNTGQQHGDVYTNDGGQQVVDTAAIPSPLFKGNAEGLDGDPNIQVTNLTAVGLTSVGVVNAAEITTDDLNADSVIAGFVTSVNSYTSGITTAGKFYGDGSFINNIGVTGIGFGLEYNYSSSSNLPGTQSGTFRVAGTGFFSGLAIHEDDLRGVDQSSFFEDLAENKRYTIYMEYSGGTCFYSGLFYNFSSSLYTFFNGELTGDLPANGTACKLMVINEVGRSIFTEDLRVTGITTVSNLNISGVTTMSDHLMIDDGTGAGTEYALNVKTTGTSRFGVLGNGNVLLGNSSASPFIAVNDHHATSKKYVDDAISTATTSISIADDGDISFGDSDDFKIYHDGTHTYLDESGQGNLKVRTNTLRVSNIVETKESIIAQPGSGVELFYDGGKKLEVTDSGVISTGVHTSTSFAQASGPVWSSGTGTPEGVVTASVGSLYSRIDGVPGATLYVKETGAGNIGWVAK